MDYDTSIDEKIHQIITAAKESDLDSDEDNPPIARFEISKNFQSLYRPKFNAKSYLSRTRNGKLINNSYKHSSINQAIISSIENFCSNHFFGHALRNNFRV